MPGKAVASTGDLVKGKVYQVICFDGALGLEGEGESPVVVKQEGTIKYSHQERGYSVFVILTPRKQVGTIIRIPNHVVGNNLLVEN